jgi:hypothetical protein
MRRWSRASLATLLAMVAGCGDSNVDGHGHADARVLADGAGADASPDQPYRHAIAIDGVDDFASGEQFLTTSQSYTARITWDDTNLYVGYTGDDLRPTTSDASTKWLFIYLDTKAGGQAQSEQYNTQRATFPSGFAADYYARYKVDGTFTTLELDDNGTWSTSAPAPATAQSNAFVELSIPLTAIGAGMQLGVVTYMINEKQLAEGSYAGLYANNFTDGYATNLVLTAYLQADFTSARTPNDLSNKKP